MGEECSEEDIVSERCHEGQYVLGENKLAGGRVYIRQVQAKVEHASNCRFGSVPLLPLEENFQLSCYRTYKSLYKRY